MTLNNPIKTKLENVLGSEIIQSHSLSGGCISNAYKIEVKSGDYFFLKINPSTANNMFIKEAHGLLELGKANVIKIPEVISYDNDYILLELIIPGSKIKEFSEDFGRKFAHLHKFNSDCFGFYEDNYIGSNPQLNIISKNKIINWTEFYFNNRRILYQYRLAEESGNSTEELRKAISLLENKIENIVIDNGVFASRRSLGRKLFG